MPVRAPDTQRILDAFDEELSRSADQLDTLRVPVGGLAAELANSRMLMNWLFDGGWVRWGWPEHVGGLGGSAIIRYEILERLALRGYDIPHHLQVLEVLGPVVVSHAPRLAAALLPAPCGAMNCGARAFRNRKRAVTSPRCAPRRHFARIASS